MSFAVADFLSGVTPEVAEGCFQHMWLKSFAFPALRVACTLCARNSLLADILATGFIVNYDDSYFTDFGMTHFPSRFATIAAAEEITPHDSTIQRPESLFETPFLW